MEYDVVANRTVKYSIQINTNTKTGSAKRPPIAITTARKNVFI